MAQALTRYLPKRPTVDVRTLAMGYGAKMVVPSGRDIWCQFTSETIAIEFFHHIRDLGIWSGGAFRGNYSHTWDVRVRVSR
jgi:hypothetical protein